MRKYLMKSLDHKEYVISCLRVALDEIYKIYKLLHRSAFKNSAKFRQTFSHFSSFIFKISLIFRNFVQNLTNFDEKIPEFQQIC